MNKTKRLAFVCAFNPGRNSGMITVDSAIFALQRGYPVLADAEITLFNIEKPFRVAHGEYKRSLFYTHLSHVEQLYDYDRIVFWGDFLPCRRYYLTDVVGRLMRNDANLTRDAAMDFVRSTLLMASASEDLRRKVICFGSSLYLNTIEDEADKDYMGAIRQLYNDAALVLVRDPVSAAFAANYRTVGEDNLLGVDGAFLLTAGDRLDWRVSGENHSSNKARKRIGYSFGRSLSKSPATLDRLTQLTAEFARLNESAEIVDIGWLDLPYDNALNALSEKMGLLVSCDAIITDTYHCAINAWREGVPAICVGAGVEPPTGTLSEKKKEILYSMFNARDYYVFFEELQEPRSIRQVAARLHAVAQDETRKFTVSGHIRSSVDRAKTRLLRALQG